MCIFYITIKPPVSDREFGGKGPVSQPAAGPRSAEQQQEEQEQEQHTNEVQFALVGISFAQLSRTSSKYFPFRTPFPPNSDYGPHYKY